MPGENTRVLVLGATGMLGHEVIRVLSDGFQVHATARDPEHARSLGIVAETHALDAMEPGELPGLIDRAAPDAIVNCVGIVKQLREASMPIPSIAVNSAFPHIVADACASRGVRLIHISTDCVFSGRLPAPAAYTEADVPDPLDLYGRSKLLGELDRDDALTLRTSIIGPELGPPSGLLEWLRTQAGGPVNGFANARFSGLTTVALARVIETLLSRADPVTGLYHVSTEGISKSELVTKLDAALDLGCEITTVEEPVVNRVLDSARFRADTGIVIPGWDEMIDELGAVYANA